MVVEEDFEEEVVVVEEEIEEAEVFEEEVQVLLDVVDLVAVATVEDSVVVVAEVIEVDFEEVVVVLAGEVAVMQARVQVEVDSAAVDEVPVVVEAVEGEVVEDLE